MYGFIREGVAVGEEEKKEDEDEDEDDLGQRLLDRRSGDGRVSNQSVGYRKQKKLNARTDSEVTHFGNFIKGSLKVTAPSQ